MNQHLLALAHKGGRWTKNSLLRAGFTGQQIQEALRANLLTCDQTGTYTIVERRRHSMVLRESQDLQPGQTVLRVVNGQVKQMQVVSNENGKLQLIDPEDQSHKVEQADQSEVSSAAPNSEQPQPNQMPTTESAKKKSLAERLLENEFDNSAVDRVCELLLDLEYATDLEYKEIWAELADLKRSGVILTQADLYRFNLEVTVDTNDDLPDEDVDIEADNHSNEMIKIWEQV